MLIRSAWSSTVDIHLRDELSEESGQGGACGVRQKHASNGRYNRPAASSLRPLRWDLGDIRLIFCATNNLGMGGQFNVAWLLHVTDQGKVELHLISMYDARLEQQNQWDISSTSISILWLSIIKKKHLVSIYQHVSSIWCLWNDFRAKVVPKVGVVWTEHTTWRESSVAETWLHDFGIRLFDVFHEGISPIMSWSPVIPLTFTILVPRPPGLSECIRLGYERRDWYEGKWSTVSHSYLKLAPIYQRVPLDIPPVSSRLDTVQLWFPPTCY